MIGMPFRFLCCLATIVSVLSPATLAQGGEVQSKPNFLIIVVDDMGWSDPGFLGSSIKTPNIDALARSGTFFSDFYVAPTCSPTRAMLMTGVSSHAAGLGTMHHAQTTNQVGLLEYGAQLHDGVVTMAEMLQEDGYATFLSGKWHLAVDADQRPSNRGFERSFGLLEGGASHFYDGLPIHQIEHVTYLEDGQPHELSTDFYSTYAYTDKIIEYIDTADDKPFLAYLAYTAPHDPLQVPSDWMDRYDGVFNAGPAHEKAKRVERLVQLGLLTGDEALTPARNFPRWLDAYKAPWTERDPAERAADATRMEIYAAMIELMDEQIGRVLARLEEKNELENTYIFFMSDNGASAGTPFTYPGNNREWVNRTFDLSDEKMGTIGSFTTMGREWTNASNTPFRLFKVSAGEGGVRSPLILAGPGIKENAIASTPVHVTDVLPTIQKLASLTPSEMSVYDGKMLPQGASLLPLPGHAKDQPGGRPIVIELFGNRMVRMGDRKAVYLPQPLGSGTWELYNIDADPSATENLASAEPATLAELTAVYDEYAAANNIVAPIPPIKPQLNSLYDGPCNWWCQSKFTFADMMVDPTKRKVFGGVLAILVSVLLFVLVRRFRKRA